MAREFTIIIEKGEDGYLISEVLEIPGCHTQAKTIDELLKRTREAIRLCLKAKAELSLETFVGIQKMAV